MNDTTWPSGKTFGELTPEQKQAAMQKAADQLQATTGQGGTIEDEREQAYRDRDQREAAIAALAERFWQGAALPAERMAGHLAAIAWENGWRPPASGEE